MSVWLMHTHTGTHAARRTNTHTHTHTHTYIYYHSPDLADKYMPVTACIMSGWLTHTHTCTHARHTQARTHTHTHRWAGFQNRTSFLHFLPFTLQWGNERPTGTLTHTPLIPSHMYSNTQHNTTHSPLTQRENTHTYHNTQSLDTERKHTHLSQHTVSGHRT